MEYNFLQILSFVVVFLTVITMVFGLLADFFYKAREVQKTLRNETHKNQAVEKQKYLYFVRKEMR
jgi:heme/copper-type cytochrome/quinol oxidase subunit 2